MNEQQRIFYLQQMGVTVWQSRECTIASAENQDLANPWEALNHKIKNCQACGLEKTRTQTVFGVGNRQADLLIVGEAPGFHEDQQGEPFVGRAGQLLDNMLKAIGLNRQTVFIANILKCRPPNNRDPKPEEVTSCTPFLIQQIELLQPKMIVAVGRIAAHFLLKTTTPLNQLRGQQFDFQGIPLRVTFHPAYLLRSPSDKAKAWIDLLAIHQELQRLIHSQEKNPHHATI
ncbi:MAG: uracil-DNA glycosylase [Legionellales bacterium]|nr:uracil-DNA glycosylase [Legionellales bacterium]